MAGKVHMGSRFGIDSALTEGEIALDGTQTSLVFKVNGRSMGVCLSEQGNHAEVNMLNLLREWQTGRLSRDQTVPLNEQAHNALGGGTAIIDAFITRSPCPACATALIGWVAGANPNIPMRLRLFCATIYKGEATATSIADIGRLRNQAGIEVWRWDVVNMARGQDADSLKLLQVACGNAMNEAGGNYQITNWLSRLGAPNLTALPYMPLNNPTNFYVTS
jgi:hypothetical protein